jgi:lactate permease
MVTFTQYYNPLQSVLLSTLVAALPIVLLFYLVAFSFGACLEGTAGFGTPVAICAALMVGLGFPPLTAAVLCLIANTAPVAFGEIGTPLLTLARITDLPKEAFSQLAGRQLPFISVLVPAWLVRTMVPTRATLEVWPAILVCAGSWSAPRARCATHCRRP